ncbi:ornithine--oxo-acid transaminase [Dechloromonas sp. H13]|uniref:ornithine--oxo-acid transaminase n=1 Tax=Dechloromonas sp. H13 TaxID=2570193 RepID=UPI00129179FD|nr:ornithine--oxo-acid transaminase [Dechloromonas sp. H13]
MRRFVPMNPTVRCIGVASRFGAPFSGCERAPEVLRQAGLAAVLRHNGLAAEWLEMAIPEPSTAAIGILLRELADTTAAVILAGERPLVIGGDHSTAAGTWRGIGRALGQAPGLIWIDAHLDAHTPASTPSGNAHGMPLAALLGEGDPAMVDIPGPPLDPARTVVIGMRSCEPAEATRLAASGVRIFAMDEIAGRGLAEVFAEALRIVGNGPWGISLDLDAIDPEFAPGVSTAVAGGLLPASLRHEMRGVLRQRNCVGLEIAEYDPASDPDRRTAALVSDLLDAASAPDSGTLRRWEAGFSARNYEPLPVVLHEAQGCWATDVDGHRYLDLMSAYSATSFGHAHPRLVGALAAQASRLAVTSRAYANDRLPQLLRRLALLTGYDRVLPVNTGLEAVETALKAARKWAYEVKGVPRERAEIIACAGNFHGRSITIVGLSSDRQYRDGFGPFPPGLKRIPYGDAAALAAAITPNTAAFLVEPIQGEGGIILPPAGYLAACAAICRQNDVLLIADEVQTGLGRTGRLLACQHEGVRPDGLILGKALGGGLLPVSAFLADEAVMQVFSPGDHGSTFGGNPLACHVALTALDVLEEEGLTENSAVLGELLLARLHQLKEKSPMIVDVRGRGLFAGIELDPRQADARALAEALLDYGVLTKDTHGTVLRLAPPLIIGRAELEWGLGRIAEALNEFQRRPRLAA